ncbi:MAG: DUF4381 family protein [Betaproteobacteria bacterium]
MLDQLHPLLLPAPPSWLPQTPAWGVLAALLALALAALRWRGLRRWQASRHRRRALGAVVERERHLHEGLLAEHQQADAIVGAARKELVEHLAHDGEPVDRPAGGIAEVGGLHRRRQVHRQQPVARGLRARDGRLDPLRLHRGEHGGGPGQPEQQPVHHAMRQHHGAGARPRAAALHRQREERYPQRRAAAAVRRQQRHQQRQRYQQGGPGLRPFDLRQQRHGLAPAGCGQRAHAGPCAVR